ncbi:glycoside hydrolase family 55 protein [bacterium]|nr:glycoside hydrolase family 55 protein [bacterium]
MVKTALLLLLLILSLPKEGKTQADPYASLPHGTMFRNVRDFGAKGDGVSDDTQAFINALDHNVGIEGEKKHGTVYIPPGNYVIKDTLIIWKGTHLIGDMSNPPTLILPSKTEGFSDASNPKPLIVTANGWGMDPKSRDWQTRRDDKGGSTNNTFFTSIRNIKIRIESGNPGAIGIYWCVAQATALRDVEIEGGDAYACIRTSLWGGGGVISNIKVIGGERGWEVDQTSQFLIRSATFSQQSLYAIRLRGIWNFVFLDLRISNVKSGVVLEGGNCVSFIDSSFENIEDGIGISPQPMPACLFLQNITSEGLKEIVKGLLFADGNRIDRWIASEEIYKDGEKVAKIQFKGKLEKLPSPAFPRMSEKVRSVTEFGALPDDGIDDTEAIQEAINKCEEIYFPSGEYLISDTLHLKPHTKLFGEHPARIILRSEKEKFKEPDNPAPMIETPDAPDGTITIVNMFLSIDEAMNGAYFINWRVGEKSKIVDVYLFANENQPFIWRISGKGGGFFENLWWPAGYAIEGKTGAIITSTGRKWFYSWQHEHFSQYPVIFRNVLFV